MSRRRKPKHAHQPPERTEAVVAYTVHEAASAISAHFAATIASERHIMRAALPQRAAPQRTA